MISGSRSVAALCLCCAIGAHLGTLVLGLNLEEEAQIEGMSGATTAILGNAFEDMAMGTLQAEVSDSLTKNAPALENTPPPKTRPAALEPTRPTTQTPLRAKPTPAKVTPPQATTAAPVIAHAIVPTAPLTSATPPPAQSANRPVEPLEAPTLEAVIQPLTLAAATPPPDTSRADREPDPTDVVTARPKLRTPELEKRFKQQAKPPVLAGNASRNAAKGSDVGSVQATATRQGGQGQSKESGNAAATNYPGEVMRALSRVGRPKVGKRGTALVAFRVARSGALEAASIAQTSGSAKLDQAALGIIHKAAPFPAPPKGAQRAFRIKIIGR